MRQQFKNDRVRGVMMGILQSISVFTRQRRKVSDGLVRKTKYGTIVIGLLYYPLVFAASEAQKFSPSALDCYQSFSTSQYQSAASACNTAAEAGDPQAQYLMAIMHVYGAGVPTDLKTSVSLLTEAAAQGHIKAAYNLGAAYDLGEGVDIDYGQAQKWYAVAANAGMPEAQQSLAAIYESGKGTTTDLSEAFRWYSKAAEQGYTHAQYKLGLMFQQGQGTEVDVEQAKIWLKLAAQAGNANAQLAYGLMIVGDTPAEAVFWLERAGHRGVGVAYYQLAILFRGNNNPVDLEHALSYAERAVFEGNPDALALRDQILADISRLTPRETVAELTPQTTPEIVPEKIETSVDSSETTDEPTNVNGLRDEQWLMSQPPDQFTVQLKHSDNKGELDDFISEHGLGASASYYPTLRDAGVVYVLVYGQYESLLSAEAAAKELPTKVRELLPWVRKFEKLQSLYREPFG